MHFTIMRSTDGQYYWKITGGNYETIAVSETYTSKASAQHAIEVVRAQAAKASVLDISDNRYDRRLP